MKGGQERELVILIKMRGLGGMGQLGAVIEHGYKLGSASKRKEKINFESEPMNVVDAEDRFKEILHMLVEIVRDEVTKR